MLTWSDYIYLLQRGPLSDDDKELCKFCLKNYQALRRGEYQWQMDRLKKLVARTFKSVNHGSQTNRITHHGQADLTEIF